MPNLNSQTRDVFWPDVLTSTLERKNWSQKSLAELLDRDQSMVSLYCSGRAVPKITDRSLIRALARFLELRTEQLEECLRAFRPAGQFSDARRRTRVATISELEVVIEEDYSGVLRNLYLQGAFQALGDRLRELGYEISDVSSLTGSPVGAAKPSRPVLDRPFSALTDFWRPSTNSDRTAIRTYGKIYERDLQVRDTVRSVCATLDAAFATTESNELAFDDVAAIIVEKYGWCTEPLLRQIHAGAVFSALNAVRYIELYDNGTRVRRRWRLTGSLPINRWFGYGLRIPRFNFLLDGGLLLPGEDGLVILVTGRPGVGKTMLSLQMVASLACDGFVVVHMSAEENPNSLIDKLSYIGYERVPHSGSKALLQNRGRKLLVDVTRDIPTLQWETAANDRDVGCLLLTAIPNRNDFLDPKSPFLTSVKSILDTCAKHDVRTAIVLDSLDALGNLAGRDPGHRRRIEAMFNFARNSATIGMFVGENHQDAANPAEYLADLQITMGYKEQTISTRTLTITKARFQSFIRGPQPYAIHSGRGIECYPSIQARLSVSRRRIMPRTQPESLSWSLPGLDFDQVLAGDLSSGDCLLLKGPPATHKTLLGLSFLSSGLTSEPDKDILLVSLRQGPSSLLRVLSAHEQFQNMLTGGREAINDRVRVLHRPPDYFSAARFFQWIREVFKSSRRGISRVLFLTLDQLRYSSPLIDEEPLLIPALIEFFRAKGATSFFVAAGDDSARADPIQAIFDTVLITGKSAHTDEVTLSVAHTGPCNASQDSYRLLHSNGHLRIEAVMNRPERAQ